MGYPKHLLVAFGGPLGSKESWSCSLRMTSSTFSVLPDAALDEYAENNAQTVHDKVFAYLQSLGGKWNAAANLGFVKVNGINSDGHYIGDTHGVINDQPEIVAPGSNNFGAFQLSMVMTLLTERTRGLGTHGRFYLPAPYLTVDKEGLLNPTTAASYASLTSDFITQLNNWPGSDVPGAPNVCVVSRGKKLGPKTWGEGTFGTVNRVAVGTVMDTQQSRRRSLLEGYQVAVVTP